MMIDETSIYLKRKKRKKKEGGGGDKGFSSCFVISVFLYLHYSYFSDNSFLLTNPFPMSA
jgi:hypothetical protein